MVNKKIVIISTILVVLIVSIIVGIKVKKFNEQRNSYNEETITISQNETKKEILTEERNDITNDAKNEALDEVTEENNTNSSLAKEQQIHNETNSQNIKGEEELETQETESKDKKAISLVKKEWGETDDTVYYTIDNNSNNIYNISVRSKSTTRALAEYEVDIKNNKVTIK